MRKRWMRPDESRRASSHHRGELAAGRIRAQRAGPGAPILSTAPKSARSAGGNAIIPACPPPPGTGSHTRRTHLSPCLASHPNLLGTRDAQGAHFVRIFFRERAGDV
jgi:hypothetical protein